MRTEMANGAQESAAVREKFENTLEKLQEVQERTTSEKNEHINRLEEMQRRMAEMNEEHRRQMAEAQRALIEAQNQRKPTSGCPIF
jgi:TolA-binding protein